MVLTTAATAGTNLAEEAALEAEEAAESRYVIGKMKDLTPENLGPGERTLDLPDLGNARDNWYQNSSRLREAMGEGQPIRDASVDASGALRDNTGFLRAERNLLDYHEWEYNPATTAWHPPTP
jgi:hypothetical protein